MASAGQMIVLIQWTDVVDRSALVLVVRERSGGGGGGGERALPRAVEVL